MAIGEAVSALAALFCARFKMHLKWLAVSLCYFRSPVFAFSLSVDVSVLLFKLLKAETPKDVRKKLVVQLQEALLICRGKSSCWDISSFLVLCARWVLAAPQQQPHLSPAGRAQGWL